MQVKRAADAAIGSERLDGVARDRVLARSLGADHRLLERAPTTLLRRALTALNSYSCLGAVRRTNPLSARSRKLPMPSLTALAARSMLGRRESGAGAR